MPLLPQQDIDAAAKELETAFVLCGLVVGSTLQCPECGTTKPKKVELNKEKFHWKCFRCGSWGTGIKLVQERLSVSFPQAVNLLLGRHRDAIPAAKVAALTAEIELGDSFTASTEPWVWDIYAAVLDSEHVSLAAAQRYYAEWHIDGDVVADQRARYITDPGALRTELLATFSSEQLLESGLFVERRPRKGEPEPQVPELRMLCGWNYPQIEPAIDHRGRVRNMQFRPSPKQRTRLVAHKRGDGPYVPPFMSIKGAGPRHLIGCGTERLMRVASSTVYVVEGFKDLLATNTLGAEGYAMPGTNILPPPGLVEMLAARGHTMLVALDGDEAGTKARPKVAEHFRTNGFADTAVREKDDMPPGMDVTDILVARHADKGCGCNTCSAWRSRAA